MKKIWFRLFLFCSGLLLASAFSMKWMEPDFLLNEKLFTIIQLEFSLSKTEMLFLVTHIDDKVRLLLNNHLVYDFVFMAGVYPTIACLCMMVRDKVNSSAIRKILSFFAFIQILAWFADILENIYLMQWINQQSVNDLYDHFHIIVWAKWLMAVGGLFVAGIAFLFFRKKPIQSNT